MTYRDSATSPNSLQADQTDQPLDELRLAHLSEEIPTPDDFKDYQLTELGRAVLEQLRKEATGK